MQIIFIIVFKVTAPPQKANSTNVRQYQIGAGENLLYVSKQMGHASPSIAAV
jgi:hypothetical protein